MARKSVSLTVRASQAKDVWIALTNRATELVEKVNEYEATNHYIAAGHYMTQARALFVMANELADTHPVLPIQYADWSPLESRWVTRTQEQEDAE